ncbi:MAG: aspartate kinase [Saprospiraceae bacterium]|jgi:aspartate kinase
MVVMKFGGTSVGSVTRMNEVISIITDSPESKIVVLSAMSGTTNALVEIAQMHGSKNANAVELLRVLESQYQDVVKNLFTEPSWREKGQHIIDAEFVKMNGWVREESTDVISNQFLAEGELISTALFEVLCHSKGIDAVLIPALDFMRIDENNEPDQNLISELSKPFIESNESAHILITQGYICRDLRGNISNLQRGGSDYTATLLGAALQCDEIQIWTDIDGIHNNDPRIVSDTKPIRNLSYREAAELAYFGAKILHPTCVLPAERMDVPLRLKYTMEPKAPGTLISKTTSKRSITAIAAKDGITAVKIYSHRMLNAYGFLRKVFQVFEDHETSVDMIATSEVAVSLTIDDTSQLESIVKGIKAYGEVEVSHDHTIICIVGNELYTEGSHVQHIFEALHEIPTRMVSMGGSNYNISVLIPSDQKTQALQALNTIFE